MRKEDEPTDGRSTGVVGSILTLNNDYDKNQSWFSFVNATIFFTTAIPKEKTISSNLLNRINEKVITNSKFYLYNYEKGVDQYVLPFPDRRVVSTIDWETLRNAGYPGWDTVKGTVYMYHIRRVDRKEILDWLEMGCSGRYMMVNHYVRFQKKIDYAMTILRFA